MIREFSKLSSRSLSYLTKLPNLPFYIFSTHKQSVSQKTEAQRKAMQTIAKNTGMNQFLTRVYNTTGLSVLGALTTSYIVMSSPVLASMMSGLSLLGVLGTFGGFIGSQYIKPIEQVEQINGVQIYKTANPPSRILLYSLGTVGLGLTAAPLFAYSSVINPMILPTAIGLTSAIFGGASILAYNMPKDKMLNYGGVLSGSLLGLIGLQLIGLISSLVVGPNAFSSLLFRADSYIGIGLFSAFIAYDTHLAIKMYQEKIADHLGISIQFLLNFWNILIRIVSILSRRD